MNAIKTRMKEKYNLSNYQIALLSFLFKTVSSEVSKMILMGFLFHNYLPRYFFILFVMVLLRTVTGGLHFYTYLGCFAASIAFVGSALFLSISFPLPLFMEMILLLACMLVCYVCGPVTSKYRPKYSAALLNDRKKICAILVFTYALLLYIIPENSLLQTGFWVIILHTIQLLVGKLITKGGDKDYD